MHDLAISLAYLLSASVLAWVAMRESETFRRMKALKNVGPSESEAHIFCCCSIGAAYALHALA